MDASDNQVETTGATNSSVFNEMTSKISFVILVNISSAILGYIAIMLANRFIGTYDFGVVVFGLSFGGLFFFISDLGFSTAHIKRISEGQNEASVISAFVIIKLILTGIMIAIAFSSIFIWEALGGGYADPNMKKVIFIIMTYYILASLGQIFSSTYNARRDAIRQQSMPLAEVLFRCLAVIVVSVYGFGIIGLSVTWLVAGIAFIGMGIALYRGPVIRFLPWQEFINIAKSYMKFALPLSVFLACAAGSQYLDKILIQIFFDSNQVAFFFGSQRLLVIFLAIASAISIMLFPLLSEMRIKKPLNEVSIIASKAIYFVLLITIPIAFFAFALAEPILGIFINSDYVVAANAFRILTITYIFSGFIAPCTSFLLGVGNSKLVARLGILFALIIIFLDFLFIPPKGSTPFSFGLGIEGAAFSLLIAYVIFSIATIMSIRKRTVFSISKSIIPMIIIAMISSASVKIIYTEFGAERFYHVLVYFGIDIAMFISLVLLLRVVPLKDITRILGVFRPKNFFKSLRS